MVGMLASYNIMQNVSQHMAQLLPIYGYTHTYLLSVDSWLRSGIVGADSVVVLSKPTVHLPDQHEHMVDIESIMAIRQLAKSVDALSTNT